MSVCGLQVAVAFADMHDTPVRMLAKGVLHGIVPWSRARPFLFQRLTRRCAMGVRQLNVPLTWNACLKGLWFLTLSKAQ